MTHLRKLAVKISNIVIRRCPPAYKDWAHATSRELEFIESDWAALRWALGSWKMAARCRWNAPLTSISEVPHAAQKFLRATRVLTVANRFSLLCITACFPFLATYTTRQVGLLIWCLVIAAATYLVCDIVRWGWRFSSGGGLPEDAAAYRSELVRQQDRLSGGWYSSFMAINAAATALTTYNLWLTKISAVREIMLPILLVICGYAVVMLFTSRLVTRHRIAIFQRRIDELDALECGGR